MIEIIKKLRDETGLSVGEIKRALEEAGGDEKKAKEVLRSRGHDLAAKKSAREVKSGVIDSYIHGNSKIGSLVVLYCETDFVAKSPDFKELAHELAMQIASMNPQTAEELLGQPFVREQGITVKDLIDRHIAKLGENIKVGEFVRFQV